MPGYGSEVAEEGAAHSDQHELIWALAAASVAVVTLALDLWANLWLYAFYSAAALVWTMWRIRANRKHDRPLPSSPFFWFLALLAPVPLYELTSGDRVSLAILWFGFAALAGGAVASVVDIRHGRATEKAPDGKLVVLALAAAVVLLIVLY
jgi:hypothetical protein